jgi:hypothetical protein
LELTIYAMGGRRGFIGGQGWTRMVDELCKVMVFLESAFGSSPVGVLPAMEKKDGKKVLGLKVSSPNSGGA